MIATGAVNLLDLLFDQKPKYGHLKRHQGHGQQDQQLLLLLLQQQQQQLGQQQDTGGTHQLQKVQLLNSGGILQLQIDQTGQIGQIGQILLQKGQICGNKSLFHSNLKL